MGYRRNAPKTLSSSRSGKLNEMIFVTILIFLGATNANDGNSTVGNSTVVPTAQPTSPPIDVITLITKFLVEAKANDVKHAAEIASLSTMMKQQGKSISKITGKISKNAVTIKGHSGRISKNAGGISKNAVTIKGHSGRISKNAGEISKNAGGISKNAGAIKGHTGQIANLKGMRCIAYPESTTADSSKMSIGNLFSSASTLADGSLDRHHTLHSASSRPGILNHIMLLRFG